MQRSELEWIFRLATEPGRLWRMYAQYPFFFALLMAQLIGIKRFEIDG